ncbi:MAG: DUF5615 family PIN-like protein [Armatimonadetes bacterium]|nr:DUF5615 family PIN-like protein [Armatimonadota bacterium]
MLIKADENIPRSVVVLLRSNGHDAMHLIDQNMGGWSDSALWLVVQAEGRFLVTTDKGFGDLRAYPPGAHAGVMILRPDEDGVTPLLRLVAGVLATEDLELLAGTTTVVTPRGIRVRRIEQ